MDEESQVLYSRKGDSSTTAIGKATEKDALELLKSFASVKSAWTDNHNSKFDLYFNLHGDEIVRGLQVKTLGRVKNKNNAFDMTGLNKYEPGMLIVALNREAQIGLFYFYSETYNTTSARIHVTPNPRGIFSKLIMNWNDFKVNFEKSLPSAIQITKEIFNESMTLHNRLEHESINRFIIYLERFGVQYKRMIDDSSATDIIVNGFKVQMKYSSKPHNPDKSQHEHPIHLGRSRGRVPYKKGDNDFYVIEVASKHGEFIILPEQLLIDKGFIITENCEGRCDLSVYPYDHVEKLRAVTHDPRAKALIKGNWTCDKSLWWTS
jgi:hypothetical protein